MREDKGTERPSRVWLKGNEHFWSALWSSQGRDKQGHPQCPNGHPCTECLEGGLSPCHLLSSVSIHIKINPAGALHCLENAHGFHAHQVQVPISQTSGQSLSLRGYFSIIHLCFRLQLREISLWSSQTTPPPLFLFWPLSGAKSFSWKATSSHSSAHLL